MAPGAGWGGRLLDTGYSGVGGGGAGIKMPKRSLATNELQDIEE